jgi:hypothetical protein
MQSTITGVTIEPDAGLAILIWRLTRSNAFRSDPILGAA